MIDILYVHEKETALFEVNCSSGWAEAIFFIVGEGGGRNAGRCEATINSEKWI